MRSRRARKLTIEEGQLDALKEDLAKLVDPSSESSDFIQLVRITGLDPKTDFIHADLTYANLAGLDLRGFEFRGADLRGANITNTIFDLNRIVGAKFDRADVKTAIIENYTFFNHVIHGLGESPKWLSAKYFYDAAGSELFEEITRLPEYYPTRTELSILEAHASDMAATIPLAAALVEFGAGSTKKARIMLRAAPQIAAYVPVDISGEFLAAEAAALRRDMPNLAVLPVVADFTRDFELPAQIRNRARVGFFPGSTIGNFEPQDAAEFLRQAGRVLGSGATMIIGIDLIKDDVVLNAAYDDAAGVTARFNLNVLTRMNRELGGNFDLSAFRHRAFYNAADRRIEMHLESLKPQSVTVAGHTFAFRKGETIHTESSYKYTVDSFRALATSAGWRPTAVWTDERRYFSIHALKI